MPSEFKDEEIPTQHYFVPNSFFFFFIIHGHVNVLATHDLPQIKVEGVMHSCIDELFCHITYAT